MAYGDFYIGLDPYKRATQLAARTTGSYLERFGMKELEWTRGESVYVVQLPDGSYIGFLVEGLGTANIAADHYREILTFVHHFTGRTQMIDGRQPCASVAITNCAMHFNDMATLGIRPVVFGQHLAVGDERFFNDVERWEGYIEGTVAACTIVRCSWGCGETPKLQGIVYPETALIGGGSWGICPKGALITGNIVEGDCIYILDSSGIHGNGYTMARGIADDLPAGYMTHLPNGETYGEALLKPTVLYSPFIETCQDLGAVIHYAVNVTGHGWRKFMRHLEPFVYVIDEIPSPQPIFSFMQQRRQLTLHDMYADFNMGAGFALMAAADQEPLLRQAAEQHGRKLLKAGGVEKHGDEKRLEIRPLGKEGIFQGSELAVR